MSMFAAPELSAAIVAADSFQSNLYLENTNNTPDTHAPYIPNVEQAPTLSRRRQTVGSKRARAAPQ